MQEITAVPAQAIRELTKCIIASSLGSSKFLYESVWCLLQLRHMLQTTVVYSMNYQPILHSQITTTQQPLETATCAWQSPNVQVMHTEKYHL